MRLRPFIPDTDFPVMQKWIADARIHALWCANRFAYPLNPDNVNAVLSEHAQKYGELPFIAADEQGNAVGFFCYSFQPACNEGMLKFVIVDVNQRGKGTAREMLRLALRFAFEITGADAVHLNVFPENPAAKKCYAHVGFTERETVPDAFAFGGERWGRCNMIIRKEQYAAS